MRWLAVLGLLAALIAGMLASGSCLVDRRTNDLQCDDQSDCGAGRICTSGFCVMGQLPPDSPPLITCAESECAAMGGSCSGEVCTFNCTALSCPGIVTCPAGVACDVTCSDPGACGTGIACGNATSCEINCSAGACQAPLDCGGGDCTVNCTGIGACAGEVRCAQADSCIVNCTADGTCGDTVLCGGACEVNCTGDDSCSQGTQCGGACYCEVDCTGIDSCATPANCVKNQCADSPGCDPDGPGCNPSCGAP